MILPTRGRNDGIEATNTQRLSSMIAQSAASTRLTDPCELAHVKSVVGGGTYMWDRSQEASEQEQDAIVAPLRL